MRIPALDSFVKGLEALTTRKSRPQLRDCQSQIAKGISSLDWHRTLQAIDESPRKAYGSAIILLIVACLHLAR